MTRLYSRLLVVCSLKMYFAYVLVVSLGLVVMLAFFKPWLPEFIHGACLTAYEPRVAVRVFEGVVGVMIFVYGVQGAILTLRRA